MHGEGRVPAAPPQPLAMPGGCWPHLWAGSCVSKGAEGHPGDVACPEPSWVPSTVCAGAACSPRGAARCLHRCWQKGTRNPKPCGSETTTKHMETLISQGQILWFALDFPPKFHCTSPRVPWQCRSPQECMLVLLLLTRVAGKIFQIIENIRCLSQVAFLALTARLTAGKTSKPCWKIPLSHLAHFSLALNNEKRSMTFGLVHTRYPDAFRALMLQAQGGRGPGLLLHAAP